MEAIAARVAERYASEGEQTCPGENECETFQSSAADQPPEARCPSCPGRALLAVGESNVLLNTIERVVRERDSGFGFPDDITQLEKELILVWDETVESFERAHQQRVREMFEALSRPKG